MFLPLVLYCFHVMVFLVVVVVVVVLVMVLVVVVVVQTRAHSAYHHLCEVNLMHFAQIVYI